MSSVSQPRVQGAFSGLIRLTIDSSLHGGTHGAIEFGASAIREAVRYYRILTVRELWHPLEHGALHCSAVVSFIDTLR